MEKLKQFQNECNAWSRTLDYIQMEIDFLKTRLADTLVGVNKASLWQIENFQNKFITREAVLALFRKDIKEQSELLGMTGYVDINRAMTRQLKLREDIEKLEKEFSKLKLDFNNYLTELFALSLNTEI